MFIYVLGRPCDIQSQVNMSITIG